MGDPVAPAPVTIAYPSLLGGETFEIIGYPLVTVLAEKIETMSRRGGANTRERDFAAVWLLLSRHEIAATELRSALRATARHRDATLIPLLEAVENLGSARQGRRFGTAPGSTPCLRTSPSFLPTSLSSRTR